MSRSDRLAAIEQMLFRSSMGLRAVEIAQVFSVDRRTVYRDLTLLADVGVPINQKDGRFYLDRSNYNAPIRLTFDEAVALFLAARLSARLTETHNPQIVPALTKLGLALPTPLTAHIEAVTQAPPHGDDTRYAAVLETITRAWGDRRKVRIWYVGAENGKSRSREFAPYFVEPAPSGIVYAVGFDGATQRVRAFSLHRISRAQILGVSYQIPAQFDPRRYLASGWGGVSGELEERTGIVLMFSSEAAPLLQERLRNTTARLEPLDDGRLRLTLQVADWSDVLPWIRSWGPHAEVLEPKDLRDQCALEAERTYSLYYNSPRLSS